MRAGARSAAITLACAFALMLVGVAHADVAPYGLNDAGGFLNVLPPGEAGTDTAAQLALNQANGQRPPHWDDQQALYQNLLYASPTLTDAQVPNFFKDATFGVRPADVASTESPRSDVTIVRDKAYGIPHIYGSTRAGVMFGAGYAGAEDRLFLMDILRHTGRAELSSFAGGSAGNRAMDHTQWSIAPYTEADLQSQLDNAPRLYGAQGVQMVDDANSYVAGVNAYINKAILGLAPMPSEYAAFGKTPQQWTVTDLIATASLIGGIFGKGGGRELDSAQTLEAFEKRFGAKAGRAAWSDFREKNDPEAPTTVSGRFPYETASPFSSKGLALPDPGSVAFTPIGPSLSGASENNVTPAHVPIPNDSSIGSQLLRLLSAKHDSASNWELVAARHSTDGHPIAVMGPQVGYYVPQILMEEDLHGPGIDARGASFPGVNLQVQLGHGRDYAWSATTANSDNVDTFAEVLCQDDFHYVYKGQCLAMERLDRTNSWTPNVSDHTPPGSETLTAYRTVHGIVYARGTVGGRKVAFVTARSTYFHEADSVLGFSELNDPGFVTSPERFEQAASNINFGFNWSYVDADHIAYYHSGWYPQRADGTSPDFPVLGTGQFDWKGYDPSLHTLSVLPFASHPNAIDPDYLVSWNNKQAPQWAAADDRYAYGPIYRSQMIEDRIKGTIAGGHKMGIGQLVSAMDEPATIDIRSFALWPLLKRALGSPSDPRLQHAIAILDRWYADGGHRRDLNRDGVDEDTDAITLMDAWWPRLLDAEFHPALGDAFGPLRNMIDFGGTTPGATPAPPDFEVGWWGFVSHDLRDVLATVRRCRTVILTRREGRRVVRHRARDCTPARPRRVRRLRGHHFFWSETRPVSDSYSRIYCGNGSFSACQAALRRSLLDALSVTPQQIYGVGDCSQNPQASCYDQNRSVIASAISMPPFPFQNRPTFQQVVTLTRALPR
jgi:acyl-homoserine lactone acylase PvdQ